MLLLCNYFGYDCLVAAVKVSATAVDPKIFLSNNYD